jgi:choline dehydrogenase-like flavoprotein
VTASDDGGAAARGASRRSEAGAPRADVLVIGAGASGSIVAHHLATNGFSVTCLEQGGWVNNAEYPGDKAAYELLASQRFHHDPNVRRWPADYPVEVSDADIHPQMFAGVGGSTLHFGGQWPRLFPSDFRVRSLDGVADDWPISYWDLLPYYERTDAALGIAGLAGDPAYPAGAPYPLPAHPINAYGRRAAMGLNQLGWHWWPAPNAIASRDWGNLVRCARYGTCETGCPNGSKASLDLTHWPAAIGAGVKLVTGARVRAIEIDGRGRATGAVYIDRDGVERRAEADVVVVAANGVGTPRLLLLSASSRFPDGLANSSGLVGRRLMLHPTGMVIGVYGEEMEAWKGPAGQTIHSFEFYETDASRGFIRGGKWQLMPGAGVLRLAIEPDGASFDDTWGALMQRRVRDAVGRTCDWSVVTEDLPDPANTITLDPTLTDSDGIPAPKVTYTVADNNWKLLDFHLARQVEAHEAAGAVATEVIRIWPDQPGHLLGTARMGTDPVTSVCDPFGRTHDVPNVFVVDGSLFVTSGGVNPTSTICALALRTAEHLVATAGRQQVPA